MAFGSVTQCLPWEKKAVFVDVLCPLTAPLSTFFDGGGSKDLSLRAMLHIRRDEPALQGLRFETKVGDSLVIQVGWRKS